MDVCITDYSIQQLFALVEDPDFAGIDDTLALAFMEHISRQPVMPPKCSSQRGCDVFDKRVPYIRNANAAVNLTQQRSPIK